MAKYDPSGVTGYSAGDAEDVDDAEGSAPSIPFPDPFGPYPDEPYPGGAAASEAPQPPYDADPPTDPGMAPVSFDDGFDPFAANAFWFPERPWYRKSSATAAFVAIGVAVVAMLVAAVLLVSRDSGESRAPPTPPRRRRRAPRRRRHRSTSSPPPEAPPPPPPPPESPPPPEQPGSTWAPQYPRNPAQNGGDRPNVTTPQTRPPQISVRPSHRPAFPNQPGGG